MFAICTTRGPYLNLGGSGFDLLSTLGDSAHLVIYKGERPSDLETEFLSPASRYADALLVHNITVPVSSYGSTVGGIDYAYRTYEDHIVRAAIQSGQAVWWAAWTGLAVDSATPFYNENSPVPMISGDVTTLLDGTGEVQYDDTNIVENIEYVLQPFTWRVYSMYP